LEKIYKKSFFAGNFFCRLWWSGKGVKKFEFKYFRRRAKRERESEKKGLKQSVPEFVSKTIFLLEKYFNGEKVKFEGIPVDTGNLSDFSRSVYKVVRNVSYGKTISYSEVARLAGFSGACRAVGSALKRNPVPIIIPCHRVVKKNGDVGGFSASGGVATKIKLLQIEGLIFIFFFVCMFLGCCRICRNGGSLLAEENFKSSAVEVSFSNMCSDDVVVNDVKVVLMYSRKIESSSNGFNFSRREKTLFGESNLLGKIRIPSGEYFLKYSILLNKNGNENKILSNSSEIFIKKGKIFLDITLVKSEDGCKINFYLDSGDSRQEKCYESDSSEIANPPC